mgnify:CR=1 FL=1
MDYAATTPVKPEVLEAMMPYYTTYFGNASSFHQFGREAKEGLDKGRAQVASLINADPREVYFTNGGSESDNWALEGTAFARRNIGNHIITSKIGISCFKNHTCMLLYYLYYLLSCAYRRTEPLWSPDMAVPYLACQIAAILFN